jgi:hypothetical protein
LHNQPGPKHAESRISFTAAKILSKRVHAPKITFFFWFFPLGNHHFVTLTSGGCL